MVADVRPSTDDGQVHILEMLTLFWLFFSTASFLLRVDVPNPNSPASDGAMEYAARDAIELSLGSNTSPGPAFSHLTNHDSAQACNVILEDLPVQYLGRCWITMNHAELELAFSDGQPEGRSITAYRMVVIDDDAWTIGIQIWPIGGGIAA